MHQYIDGVTGFGGDGTVSPPAMLMSEMIDGTSVIPTLAKATNAIIIYNITIQYLLSNHII